MNVLGLFGSPRRGGNTDILLEEFLRGSASRDAQIERIYVSRLRIKGCQGCMECASKGVCAIEDDMNVVYTALDRATHIVVASPIYFYGVTSQIKAVIDRAQIYWSKKYAHKDSNSVRKPLPPKKGFFISVGATSGKQLFDGAIFSVRYFFNAIDVEYVGELLYRGVDEKGAIKGHPAAVTECYEAGVRFVS